MICKILNNTLIITTCALAGNVLYNCNDLLFGNKYELYYKKKRWPTFYNDGFLIGGIIGSYITLLGYTTMVNKLIK